MIKGYEKPKTIGQIVSKGYTDHQQKRSKNKKFKNMKLTHGIKPEQAPGDDNNQEESDK